MELTTFTNGNKVIRVTILLSITCCTVITIAYCISMYFITKEMKNNSEKMFLIDTKGQIYNTSIINRSEGRIYEYENHVRMFYTLWYSFDENNYTQNTEMGLKLIGNRGKELMNEYNDQQVGKQLAEKNLIYTIKIKDIIINMNTHPVSGRIEGIQTARRKKGKLSRTICVSFTLDDVSRSTINVHGCKIMTWDIYESHIIEPEEKQ